MDPTSIKITAEPIDGSRCKFMVSQPLHGAGVRRFASPAEAQGSPLAAAIFAIPGADVGEVIVSGNLVTVVKRGATPWTAVGKAVGQAIRAALASGAPPLAPKAEAPVATADDDTLYERVAQLFDEQVNPMVARHGGRVELIDVQDALGILRMMGRWQGCRNAGVHLRPGERAEPQQHVAPVQGVVGITDHTPRTNP